MQLVFGNYPAEGYAGMPVDIGIKRDNTYFNSAAEVAQVDTVTVGGTVATGDEITVFIDGFPVRIVAVDGDTLTTLKDKLVAALNLLPNAIQATSKTTTAFTITGLPGLGFNTSVSTDGTTTLTLVNTTGVVTATSIPLGVAVVRENSDDPRVCKLGAGSSDHTFLGVTVDPGYLETNIYSTPQRAEFKRNEPVSVRAFGTVWVRLNGDVNPGDAVFYSYAGGGQIGAFSTGAVGADTYLPNARWLSSGKAGGIAKLEIGSFVTQLVD